MSPFEEDECDLLSPSTRHSIRQLSCQSQALIDAIGNDTLISPPFARSNSSTPKSSGTVGKIQEEYDDDELNDELQRLGSVEEQLRQDLDNENADTMMSALKMISPLARFRYTRRTVLTPTKNEQDMAINPDKNEEGAFLVSLYFGGLFLILRLLLFLVGPLFANDSLSPNLP